MTDAVILPAIKAKGFAAGEPTASAGSGFQYKIQTHQTISQPAMPESGQGQSRSGFSISLDDDPNTLRLSLGQNVSALHL